ncbi:MAG: serine hydrolase domain-containing protein [Pseudomonadota bacterium]
MRTATAGLLLCALVAAAHADTTETEVAALLAAKPTSLLFLSSEERDFAFAHIAELYPTRRVETGDRVFPLGSRPRDLSSVAYVLGGQRYTVADFLRRPAAKGFLVWQGDVLFERYANGHDATTPWVSFSVAKSVTSMLIGAAIKDGYIESVDEPVVNYVPRFRGTGYEGATLRDVLQMASGVNWNEDYADPNSDVSRAGGANGVELVRYLARLERVRPPGEAFNYNTGETNLVGEILRAAIGNNAATYLTHKIWRPFGMESDATWLLGKAGGGETGGCCLNVTLRDYARLGIFALRGGRLADGTAVLPDDWLRDSTKPSPGEAGYGYLWWLDEGTSFRARGIFGQQIFIDPARQLVIAIHSNAPAAVDTEYHAHLERVVAAVADALPAPR